MGVLVRVLVLGFDCCGLGFMMVGTMVEWVLLLCFDGWFGFCVFIWCLMLWVGCGYLTWWFGFCGRCSLCLTLLFRLFMAVSCDYWWLIVRLLFVELRVCLLLFGRVVLVVGLGL